MLCYVRSRVTTLTLLRALGRRCPTYGTHSTRKHDARHLMHNSTKEHLATVNIGSPSVNTLNVLFTNNFFLFHFEPFVFNRCENFVLSLNLLCCNSVLLILNSRKLSRLNLFLHLISRVLPRRRTLQTCHILRTI